MKQVPHGCSFSFLFKLCDKETLTETKLCTPCTLHQRHTVECSNTESEMETQDTEGRISVEAARRTARSRTYTHAKLTIFEMFTRNKMSVKKQKKKKKVVEGAFQSK